MRDLLDRSREWPRRAIGDQPEITDRVSLHFSHISPRLKSEDILTPEEVAARLKVPESWVYEKTRALEQNAERTSLPAKRNPIH
jgi:hypothetical protein